MYRNDKKSESYLYKQENTDTDVKKTLKKLIRWKKRQNAIVIKNLNLNRKFKNFNDAKQREGEKIIIPDMNNKWRFPHVDDISLKGKHIQII